MDNPLNRVKLTEIAQKRFQSLFFANRIYVHMYIICIWFIDSIFIGIKNGCVWFEKQWIMSVLAMTRKKVPFNSPQIYK